MRSLAQRRSYAAGFFDGEGSICQKSTTRQLVLTFAQKDPFILTIIQRWIGCGRIARTPDGQHSLRFTSKADVLTAIEFLYPYIIHKEKKRRLFVAKKIITSAPGSTRTKWRKEWV